MSRYKIAVGMISGDHKAHWGLLASFMKMNNRDDFEFTPVFVRCLYLDKGRNDVVGTFKLGTDADFLWFLDSDNGFHPDAPSLFMEDFSDPDVQVVSGTYHYKNRDEKLVAGVTHHYMHDGFYNWLSTDSFMEDVINLSQIGRGSMVGTGCLMIRRGVFDVLPYPWFQTPWKQYEDGGWSLTGEDTFFSELIEEYGFDIYLDQRIKSPHYAGDSCYPDRWDQVKLTHEEDGPPKISTITRELGGKDYGSSKFSEHHNSE